MLIQDDKYKDINPLRVLKFVEAIEGDDNFAAVKKILPDTKDKVGFDESKLILVLFYIYIISS